MINVVGRYIETADGKHIPLDKMIVTVIQNKDGDLSIRLDNSSNLEFWMRINIEKSEIERKEI